MHTTYTQRQTHLSFIQHRHVHTHIHKLAPTHWATVCLRNRRQRSRSHLWWFWWACHRCWQLWWLTTGPCSAHGWRNSTPPARQPILASGGSVKRASSLWRRTPRAKAAAPSVYLEVWSLSLLNDNLILHDFVLTVKIQVKVKKIFFPLILKIKYMSWTFVFVVTFTDSSSSLK